MTDLLAFADPHDLLTLSKDDLVSIIMSSNRADMVEALCRIAGALERMAGRG